MKNPYCPECNNYLLGGDGECHDCSCGWKQLEYSKDTTWDVEYDLMEESYDRGYEDAIKAIKRNIEHFCKDIHKIEMIYEGCDIDTYEGESECTKFIKEQVLGYEEKQ